MSIAIQPFSLAALKAVLIADPLSLGFAAMHTAGDLQSAEDAFNAPRDASVPALPLLGADFWKLVIASPAELNALTSLQLAQITATVQIVGHIDIGDTETLNWLKSIWPVNLAPNTNAALVAASVKTDASLAEQEFGAGFRIFGSQISDAYNLP